MSGKVALGVAIAVGSMLFAGCTQAPEPAPVADSEPESAEAEQPAEEPEKVKVYDLLNRSSPHFTPENSP